MATQMGFNMDAPHSYQDLQTLAPSDIKKYLISVIQTYNPTKYMFARMLRLGAPDFNALMDQVSPTYSKTLHKPDIVQQLEWNEWLKSSGYDISNGGFYNQPTVYDYKFKPYLYEDFMKFDKKTLIEYLVWISNTFGVPPTRIAQMLNCSDYIMMRVMKFYKIVPCEQPTPAQKIKWNMWLAAHDHPVGRYKIRRIDLMIKTYDISAEEITVPPIYLPEGKTKMTVKYIEPDLDPSLIEQLDETLGFSSNEKAIAEVEVPDINLRPSADELPEDTGDVELNNSDNNDTVSDNDTSPGPDVADTIAEKVISAMNTTITIVVHNKEELQSAIDVSNTTKRNIRIECQY